MAKYTLVSTVKDEGPFLLEWLAYHHLIGFDQFHISSNNCSDHTDEILRLFQQQGLIIYNENSKGAKAEAPDPQRRAYGRARRTRNVVQSEYVTIIDGDEFFNIHVGDGTVGALLNRTGPFDLLSATWRVFGSSGIVNFQDQFQIEQFTGSCRPFFPPNQRFWGVKTMFRPEHVVNFGVHGPQLKPDYRKGIAAPLVWLNGSGENVYDYFLNANWFSSRETYGHALAQINHYMVRSSEAFLMKRMRGTANTVDQSRVNFEYFKQYDRNPKSDTSLQRHIPAIRKQIDSWCDSIPGLCHLHDASVSFHKAQIAMARADAIANNPQMAKLLGLMDEKDAAGG